MFTVNFFEYIPSCSICVHANLYPVYWSYPYTDPKCDVSKKSITPDYACEHFELIGRLNHE